MRIIKFKGWAKELDKFVYGDLIRWNANDGKVSSEFSIKNHDDIYGIIANSVGQFTGITDIHGIEAYDGDIVRFLKSNDTGVIIFENLCFIVETEDGNRFFNSEEFEIIGDKYERKQ